MTEKSIKCGKCGSSSSEESYFCHTCGSFLQTDMIDDPELYQLPQFKMMRILENLQHVPHARILWDDTVDLFIAKIERLRALLDVPELKEMRGNSNILEDMARFVSMCSKPEFQIAFVGTIKTGKSTLINALLGSDYASVEVTPETAALTKFRHSPQDYVKVSFYSRSEWAKLWKSCTASADKFLEEYKALNADAIKDKWLGHEDVSLSLPNGEIKENLTRWSSSRYAEHYFVKEIEVGISTLPADFPRDIVFVDTPGLSDPVGYRSDITREYIKRANVVFVCVDAQKIHREEIETIASVFSFSAHNKNKVHVIATHWDALNSPDEDWKKQTAYFESQLVGPGFFDTLQDARTNIMYSSAYIHNLCRDFLLLPDQEKHQSVIFKQLMIFSIKLDLEPTDIDQNIPLFVKKANVRKIMERITFVLARNYKALLNQDIKSLYGRILHILRRIGEEKMSLQRKQVEASQGSVKNIRKELKVQQKNKEDLESAKGILIHALKAAENATQETMKKALMILDRKSEKKDGDEG